MNNKESYSHIEHHIQPSDFISKSSLGIAIVALLILTPFSINNFIQGRPFLGTGSLVIVLILAFNTWSISKHGRYYPLFTLLGLVPAILYFLNLSIQKQGVIGVLWCYLGVISFYFMLPEKKAWMANAALFAVAIPRAWTVLENALLTRMVMTLLGVSIFSAIFVRVITDQQKKLQAQAVVDSLTGVFNRAVLKETLEQATFQNDRSNVPMTLIAIDLDHFKKVNDTFGHDAGDSVLFGVGRILRKNCRRVDKIFRLGGEEFLYFLYGTTTENACLYAEKLLSLISSEKLLAKEKITASMGIATRKSGEAWKDWMKRADEKLYQAKMNGRNRIEF